MCVTARSTVRVLRLVYVALGCLFRALGWRFVSNGSTLKDRGRVIPWYAWCQYRRLGPYAQKTDLIA